MKKAFPAFAVLFLLLLPVVTAAQKKSRKTLKPSPAAAAKETIEPLRVTSGLMTGNRIAVRRGDWIHYGAPLFEYTLASARIVNEKLEFSGSLVEAGNSKGHTITATLVSATARSANPWPSAASSTARDRKPAERKPETERNEQTQSLYSGAAEVGLGCELVFLKLNAPMQSQPLQIGVVLAHQDNERGNAINQAICHIVRAMKTGANTTELLTKLNQLL